MKWGNKLLNKHGLANATTEKSNEQKNRKIRRWLGKIVLIEIIILFKM